MSRPSATRPGATRKARCRASNASRTCGEDRDRRRPAPRSIRARISRVQSVPFDAESVSLLRCVPAKRMSSCGASAATAALVRSMAPGPFAPPAPAIAVERATVQTMPAELFDSQRVTTCPCRHHWGRRSRSRATRHDGTAIRKPAVACQFREAREGGVRRWRSRRIAMRFFGTQRCHGESTWRRDDRPC